MTTEYNQLNGLASIYAMRQLYGDTLTKYLTSPEPQGPVYWADQMYQRLTNNPHSMSNVLRKPVNGVSFVSSNYLPLPRHIPI